MQSKRNYYRSNIIIINNYFRNSNPVEKSNFQRQAYIKPKIKNKSCKEFELDDEKITKNFNWYLKTYDVLERNKLTEKNFRIAYKLTWLLSKLVTHFNSMHFDTKSTSALNISYALHESKDKTEVLFDISGNKDARYEKLINKLVNQVQKNKKNPLVQEFFRVIEDNNLSVNLINRVSDRHRTLLYKGPKYCSEKSLYIEIEKKHQQTNHDLNVSTANFYLKVVKRKNSWVVKALHPHFSCKDCQKDHEVRGYYSSKNSKIIYDERGNKAITCKNSDKLDTPGNLPSRELSPPRVKELTLFNHKKNKSFVAYAIKKNVNDIPCHITMDEKSTKNLLDNKSVDSIKKLTLSISHFTQFMQTNIKITKDNPKEVGRNIGQVFNQLNTVIKAVTLKMKV